MPSTISAVVYAYVCSPIVEIPSTNSCNEKNVLVLRKLHTKYPLDTTYEVWQSRITVNLFS